MATPPPILVGDGTAPQLAGVTSPASGPHLGDIWLNYRVTPRSGTSPTSGLRGMAYSPPTACSVTRSSSEVSLGRWFQTARLALIIGFHVRIGSVDWGYEPRPSREKQLFGAVID